MRAEELAEALTERTPIDWSHDMIRNLESGRRRIDPPLLRVLAEVLGRPADYFLYPDPYTAGVPSLSGRIPRQLNSQRPDRERRATVSSLEAHRAKKAERVG